MLRDAATRDHPPRGRSRQGRSRARAVLAALAAWIVAAGCAAGDLRWAGGPRAEDPEPSGPRYLRSYKESFYRGLGEDFLGALHLDEFLTAARRSRVVFLGDHHTDRALHDRLLDLLDRFQAAGIPVMLGLEAIGQQDDMNLREYLGDRIDLIELRRRIARRWPGSWLEDEELDAGFYRELLAMARSHRWPVFALEPAPRLPLELRDPVIARTIQRAAANHPERVVVAVVGHAHLLGDGALLARVGLPAIATGARMSVTLRRRLGELPARRASDVAADFVVTRSGIAFFWP